MCLRGGYVAIHSAGGLENACLHSWIDGVAFGLRAHSADSTGAAYPFPAEDGDDRGSCV